MSIFDRLNEWIDDLRVPEGIRRELDRAERLIRDGESAEAYAQLNELDQRRSGVWRTQFLLGLSLESLGRFEEAAGYYHEAMVIRDDALSRIGLARVRANVGRTEEARALLIEAADKASHDDDEIEALELLANLDEEAQQWGSAARSWARLRTLEPESTAWRLKEANARKLAGDRDIAVELLRSASRPDNEIRIELSILLLEEEPDDADLKEIERQLRSIIPGDRGWRWRLAQGKLLLAQGHEEPALTELFEASRGAPATALGDIHGLIATGFLRLGDDERALDHAEAAALIEPAITNWTTAARAAIQLGDTKLAQDYASRILSEEPNDEPTRVLLAQAHLDAGQDQEARAVIAPLRRTNPDSPARLISAKLALRGGDPLEALSILHDSRGEQIAEERDVLLNRALENLAPNVPDIGSSRRPDTIALTRLLEFLASLAAEHFLLTEQVPRINQLRAELDQPLSIGVLGEFNAGKSTLINAWLGEEVLATGVLPTTSHVNQIRYGPRKAARVTYADGRAEELAFSDAAKLVKEAPESIEELEFGYPHPALRSVNFWDTPGFNAPDDDHEGRAESALQSADAILWVLDARQALSQSEFARIDSVPDAAEKLIIVINKVDQFADEELGEITKHVRSGLKGSCADIHAISALEALRSATDSEDADTTDLPEKFGTFKEALDQRFFERTSVLKAREIQRRLRALVEELLDSARDRVRALDDRIDDLNEARNQRATRWQQDAFELPREVTHQLGSDVRGLREEIASSIRGADSGIRILGTTLGTTLDRQTIDELRVRLRLSLKKIMERAVAKLVETTSELEDGGIDAVEQLTNRVEPTTARTLRRRTESYLVEREGRKRLLREQLVERTLASFDARFDTTGVPTILRLAGRDDEDVQTDREAATLLPVHSSAWQQITENWLTESLDTHRQLLHDVEQDVEILRLDIEHRIVRPLESVYDKLQTSKTDDA
jgi:small GTP-binding protein